MRQFLVEVEEQTLMRRKGKVRVQAENARAARDQVHFGGVNDEQTEWGEWTGEDESHVKITGSTHLTDPPQRSLG